MIVLPQDQIDRMVEIMDMLLKYPLMTVEDIKKRYKLSSEEYEMIFDLCMPLIRETNVKKYWTLKYQAFIRELKALIFQRKYMTDIQFYKELRKLVYARSYGEHDMLEAAGVEDHLG